MQQTVKRVIKDLVRRLIARPIPFRISTSISDNQAYPQICFQASSDYRCFNEFRRNSIYNQILEHVSNEEGKEYLRLISCHPEILAAIEVFKQNDRYGNPRMYDFPNVGTVSPSTLRYIKVLTDLQTHFRSLDGLNLCEIGVGYGGQCRVINAWFKPAAYMLVDIKPALLLAQRFLDHYILQSQMSYMTMNELPAQEYDLAISNYAFTELPRDIQTVYLNKILLKSKRGYITYNAITPAEFRSYRRDELLAMLPNAQALPEEPLTHAKNCIIVWGTNAG